MWWLYASNTIVVVATLAHWWRSEGSEDCKRKNNRCSFGGRLGWSGGRLDSRAEEDLAWSAPSFHWKYDDCWRQSRDPMAALRPSSTHRKGPWRARPERAALGGRPEAIWPLLTPVWSPPSVATFTTVYRSDSQIAPSALEPQDSTPSRHNAQIAPITVRVRAKIGAFSTEEAMGSDENRRNLHNAARRSCFLGSHGTRATLGGRIYEGDSGARRRGVGKSVKRGQGCGRLLPTPPFAEL